MAADDRKPDLSAFQLEVARLFFALPASQGFLLAGGAALLAQHLTARPTEDLDFFTAPERGHVPAARDALEAAARLLARAAQIDAGFDAKVRQHARHARAVHGRRQPRTRRLSAADLRAFYATWRSELAR
jgi:hypothetical protein